MLSGIGGKTAVAKAPSGGIQIGEIAPGSGGDVFDGEKLAELYDAILGTDYKYTGTYNKVKEDLAAKGTAKVGSGVSTKSISAAQLRTRNGGSDVYVTFGGIQWEVVYVTTNRGGDVIVDLYQATSAQNARFSGGTGYTQYQKVNLQSLGSIYTNSYIRTTALGNGGSVVNWASKDQTTFPGYTTVAAGNNSFGYARFATGDLSGYLDAPANVDYQEKQSWPELQGFTGPNTSAYNLANDAYGTPAVENYYTISPYNGGYGGTGTNQKAGYGDWQNDKIWLPSLTETGNSPDGGIWQLSNDQRINKTSTATAQPAWNATEKE